MPVVAAVAELATPRAQQEAAERAAFKCNLINLYLAEQVTQLQSVEAEMEAPVTPLPAAVEQIVRPSVSRQPVVVVVDRKGR
jgi:hypothetical protein